MTDEATRAKWREKAAAQYERIKADPERYEKYLARMRENQRRRKNIDPKNYRGKHRLNGTRRAENYALVQSMKLEAGACHDCGLTITEDTLYRFDFDHRDPMDKTFTISAARTYSDQRIIEEIAKCDVVCKNCHADRTHAQRHIIRAKQSEGRRKQLGHT